MQRRIQVRGKLHGQMLVDDIEVPFLQQYWDALAPGTAHRCGSSSYARAAIPQTQQTL